MTKKKRLLTIAIFLSLLLFVCLFSLRFGSTKMSWRGFFAALVGKDGIGAIIVYRLRLPRLLGGLIAGAGLALSGVLLQSVTGNDMASPHIVGVNTGAGLAVICALSFAQCNAYLLPLFAFIGALIAATAITLLAYKLGANRYALVLIGLAVNALLSAGISFVSLLDSDVLADYHTFSVGTLEGGAFSELLCPCIFVLAAFILSLCSAEKYNLLLLGDSLAGALGVNVKRTRTIGVVLAAASAAAVVSFAGLLGFVGLIAPHIARRIFGTNVKRVLPVSALIGAILVVGADLLGRVIFAPSELPVGIFMAFLGAPFFILLLLKGGKGRA